MIKLLAIVLNTCLRNCPFNSTKGNNPKAAMTNLSNVREIGWMIPEIFAEAINDPAIKTVARNTNRWDLILFNFTF